MYYYNPKKYCENKIKNFIIEDGENKKSSEEIKNFYVREINSTICHRYNIKDSNIQQMHQTLKNLAYFREKDEFNNLSPEEQEAIRKKEEANTADW